MSRQKDKGTKWETAVARFLRSEIEFYDESVARAIQRGPLLGGVTSEDIIGIPDVAVSCKNHKRPRLGEWVDDVRKQAQNADKTIGVVFHHRPGYADPGHGLVTMSGIDAAILIGSRLLSEPYYDGRHD